VIFSFDEKSCFSGRRLVLRIGFLIHRSRYWLHLIERLKHFVGNFLLFTLGQVQGGAGAQFLPILLVGPEVKIYKGAAADVDVDHALVAEAKEGDEEDCKEYEQRRKSEQDSRYQKLGVSL
jgi:hypothetical protein